MELIYGSTAIKHWFSDAREPNDLDIISNERTGKEIYWIESFSYLSNNIDTKYVDPNLIYSIKVSHACYDINWTKHMKDICFMKQHGCVLDYEFVKSLRKDWDVVHKKKKLNFDVDNSVFFNNNVTRQFNHDELHKMLAFYERPLHERIRKDLSKPKTSKTLFELLSHDDKIKCVLEEVYVIATERYITRGLSPKRAKFLSLKDLILKLSSGWFNVFIIDNFEEILYNDDTFWLNKLEEIYDIKK